MCHNQDTPIIKSQDQDLILLVQYRDRTQTLTSVTKDMIQDSHQEVHVVHLVVNLDRQTIVFMGNRILIILNPLDGKGMIYPRDFWSKLCVYASLIIAFCWFGVYSIVPICFSLSMFKSFPPFSSLSLSFDRHHEIMSTSSKPTIKLRMIVTRQCKIFILEVKWKSSLLKICVSRTKGVVTPSAGLCHDGRKI